jgi:hypothetical protein
MNDYEVVKREVFDKCNVKLDVALDEFKLYFGYKFRSSFILRTQDDGSIYCSIHDESKMPPDNYNVFKGSFEAFLEVMREAIPVMSARNHEKERSENAQKPVPPDIVVIREGDTKVKNES